MWKWHTDTICVVDSSFYYLWIVQWFYVHTTIGLHVSLITGGGGIKKNSFFGRGHIAIINTPLLLCVGGIVRLDHAGTLMAYPIGWFQRLFVYLPLLVCAIRSSITFSTHFFPSKWLFWLIVHLHLEPIPWYVRLD